MQTLAEQLGVQAVDIPRQGNNPDILRTQQVEALANWAEGVAVMLTPSARTGSFMPPADYDTLTKADLVLELRQRGVLLESIPGTGANGNVLVEDLRSALAAYDAAKGEA